MADILNAAPDVADAARRDQDPIMDIGIAPTAWRLPNATHLGFATLQVANLEQSLAYYREVLGLHVHERSGSRALLGTTDGVTPLIELKEKPGARPTKTNGRLGLYHFAILLPDRAALGRFVAHLAEIGARAGSSDHLVSEALYLRDPDGLGIEVYADRPRSSWRAVDRQLQMASDPLDLDDLVRAAGGTAWDGMPAGTTMGHMHLHVADLEAASAFYHAALGLDKMVWAYPGALFLAAGGYHHHLGLNVWAGANAPRPTDEDSRLLEWRIVLPTRDDAREAASSVSSAGYAVKQDGDDWIVTDPWGTSARLLGG
jgi:catechol 2,3-dioxygenase